MVGRVRPIVPGLLHRPTTAAAACIVLLATACGGPQASATLTEPSGGVLRVAMVTGGGEAHDGSPFYDPGTFAISPLARCLLRTLLAYNGRPTAEGGAVLRPDLASELPVISADGRSWTFHLRRGLTYAPPLADRVIEARDFVTALEHTVRGGDVPFFEDIVGVPEFRDGSVDTIAGIEAPDATTLVIRLVKPAGDLGNRLAMASMAPLPAEALAGREDADYAGFLVSSGPYMYEGSESLALANPAAAPIWERFDPGHAVLVRNPSWNRATDGLRPAHPDRIEVVMAADPKMAVGLVDSGEVDLIGEPTPAAEAQRYLSDADLRDRVFLQAAARVQFMSLNLAQPPFDDLAVRRAVNLAIDRAAAADAFSKERKALVRVAHHAIPDLLENNLLLRYNPYPSSGDRGDLGAAREAMRGSRYDGDGDGRCDAPACRAVTVSGPSVVISTITPDLAEIGIQLVPTDLDPLDPRSHTAATLIGWGADYLSAGNFAGLFRASGFGLGTSQGAPLIAASLTGATPEQLKAWGYTVAEVPQLDSKLDSCEGAVGSAMFTCWAELDQLISERVVPWVPVAFVTSAWAFSDRVAEFSPDQDSIGPALDQIKLRADQ
jgi:ABC-type transport system substrate-binding protein